MATRLYPTTHQIMTDTYRTADGFCEPGSGPIPEELILESITTEVEMVTAVKWFDTVLERLDAALLRDEM